MTSNFSRRKFEHQEGVVPSFTPRYGCKLIVWYECYDTMVDAIAREKLAPIEALNPQSRNLRAMTLSQRLCYKPPTQPEPRA